MDRFTAGDIAHNFIKNLLNEENFTFTDLSVWTKEVNFGSTGKVYTVPFKVLFRNEPVAEGAVYVQEDNEIVDWSLLFIY